MKVLVVGANNSGKGTLVQMLGEKTGLKTIGCSSVLKEHGMDIATGKLLPDDPVLKVMYDYLLEETDSYLLDGFPRTLFQDSFMNEFMLEPDLIVVLNISEEEVLSRAVGRRICKDCGESYNLNGYRLPKVEGVCDACGGTLYQRDDDREEVVKARYNEYIEQTYPIVTRYKESNCKTIVWEFDTSQSTEDIANVAAEYIKYMLS